jgi:hypothetical protein
VCCGRRLGRDDGVRSRGFGANLATQWLLANRLELAAGSYRGYERKTTDHILPSRGRIGLGRLRPEHVDRVNDDKLHPTDFGRAPAVPRPMGRRHHWRPPRQASTATLSQRSSARSCCLIRVAGRRQSRTPKRPDVIRSCAPGSVFVPGPGSRVAAHQRGEVVVAFHVADRRVDVVHGEQRCRRVHPSDSHRGVDAAVAAAGGVAVDQPAVLTDELSQSLPSSAGSLAQRWGVVSAT